MSGVRVQVDQGGGSAKRDRLRSQLGFTEPQWALWGTRPGDGAGSAGHA